MTSPASNPTAENLRLYDEGGDELMAADAAADHVTLLPGLTGRPLPGAHIRIMWGQDMLRDLVDARYRTVICGVNDEDNSHGIIAHLVGLITTSQWNEPAVTSYARMFHDSVAVHAAGDREPYVLKYDLDSLLILALLRPRSRDHFTLDDLARGFGTVSRMLSGRRDRLPAASVSFLGARSNRLLAPDGREPSFETVLRTMHESGYRGDVYPSPHMWSLGDIGVFPSYPFPEGVARMREGSS